ncbi:hypothetical protein ACXN5S_16355 [Pseudoroseicyclus sp. H15]
MAVANTARFEEEIGGQLRPLLLRNGEIERFEAQYAPLGLYELFDGLRGQGRAPQVRHVRDLLALGLIGGGMSDRLADALIAGLGPEHDLALRGTALRLLYFTLVPALYAGAGEAGDKAASKKNEAGSPSEAARDGAEASGPAATTRPPASGTSAA